MTDQDRRNIDVVRLMYTGDNAERANVAQDIVWHVPGHNPVSGQYDGFDEYSNLLPLRMAPLSQWAFDLEDVMVNGELVMTRFRLHGERSGKSIDLRGGHLFRVDEDGKIAEGWGFASDQDALDEFFAD